MTDHTPTPWRVYEQEISDKDQAKKELCDLVEGTPKFHPVLVYITDNEWDLAPAVTGCGERSRANAAFIVSAVNSFQPMLDAIERMQVGVNHIATYRTNAWPEYGSDIHTALEKLGAGKEYDMWCCWNAVMCARDELEAKVGLTHVENRK